MLARNTSVRPWAVEQLERRWLEKGSESQTFLDFLIEAGVLDRLSARAIWLAWNGDLDERETRQLFDAEAARNAARRIAGHRPPQAPRGVLPVGARLGRYRVKGLLGWGGCGAVYLSTHPSLGVSVAVKTVPEDGIARDRFRREARVQAGIQHTAVVRVWDFEEADDTAFLVMEYVPGESLRDRLEDGPLALADAFRLACHATLALRAARRAGVTHHDVKPANLFGTAEGGFKLGDFGLARCARQAYRAAKPEDEPANYAAGGTPNYSAPEQYEAGADHRADVYSLGLTLYHCLSGVMPVPGDDADALMVRHKRGDFPPLREVAPSLPAALTEVVRKMTSVDPDRRHDDYDDLLGALPAAFGMRLEII